MGVKYVTMKNNSPNPQPGDRPKRSFFGFLRPKRNVICVLPMSYVIAMRDAIAHGRYKSWAMSIVDEYNLTRSDFRVDENTGELYYPN